MIAVLNESNWTANEWEGRKEAMKNGKNGYEYKTSEAFDVFSLPVEHRRGITSFEAKSGNVTYQLFEFTEGVVRARCTTGDFWQICDVPSQLMWSAITGKGERVVKERRRISSVPAGAQAIEVRITNADGVETTTGTIRLEEGTVGGVIIYRRTK